MNSFPNFHDAELHPNWDIGGTNEAFCQTAPHSPNPQSTFGPSRPSDFGLKPIGASAPCLENNSNAERAQRRLGWVRLMRLQLNALHNQKIKAETDFEVSAEDTKIVLPEREEEDKLEEAGDQESPRSPPSSNANICNSTWQQTPNQTNELQITPDGVGKSTGETKGAWKKKTAHVRGRISSFWRQAALAALRHEKEAEGNSSNTKPSDSPGDLEESAVQMTLSTIFTHSWPSTTRVACWRQSFQNLLGDNDGRLVFRAFLCGEFSDENLEFWTACQEYRNLSDESSRRMRAQMIYEEFIAYQSQREVNLDCETRVETERRLSAAEPDLFEASQKRIEALMEKDPYRRFLRSSLYVTLFESAQNP